MALKKNRRRRRLINKPLQIKYALIAVWLVLIAVIIIGATIYVVSWNVWLDGLTDLEAIQIPDIKQVNQQLIFWLGIGFVAIISVVLGVEIHFLHRIAGPIYRIGRNLHGLASGEPRCKIALRKNDFFHEVANEFNQMVTHFEEEEQRLQSTIHEAATKIETVLSNPELSEVESEQYLREALVILKELL